MQVTPCVSAIERAASEGAGAGAFLERRARLTCAGELRTLSGRKPLRSEMFMTSTLWKVAVIGAGPAGMFAAEALSSRGDVRVDLFEKLFAPDGLLRFGVAPDHPSIKRLSQSFDKTRDRDTLRMWGGVEYGKDVDLPTLLQHYHHIVFAHGAASDRQLGIPGESLPGVYSAREFVEWYNGHPWAADHRFPLDQEDVVVVGAGNVALDVARILVRPVEDLSVTDIAAHALDALRASKVRRVHLLVRRGPADVSFTLPEIRELSLMDGVRVVIPQEDFLLSNEDRARMGMDRGLRRIVEVLEEQRGPDVLEGDSRRVLRFHFFCSPVAFEGEDAMTGLHCVRNHYVPMPDGRCQLEAVPDSAFRLPAGMLLRSIGYRVEPTPGLPYDDQRQVIRNREGQVVEADGTPLKSVWVTGWARRGPSGVVGTNKADAQQVAAAVLEQCVGIPPSLPDWIPKGGVVIDLAAWAKINEEELRRGEAQGKSREKFVRVAAVERFLEKDSQSEAESG